MLDAVERYLTIEDIVGAASAVWAPPAGVPFRTRSYDEAENAASRLRNQWNLGLDAIPNFAEFLEEQGIKVIMLPLPGSVSGLMARIRRNDGRMVPVIVVNETHTGERQRLTLAHELGHLVLDVAPNLDDEQASFRLAAPFLCPLN